MEKGPLQDPGEDPPPPGPSSNQETEITDLRDQFEQQQLLIAQLKEMVRKTDQSKVTQEKVDRYASTLSKMIRAKKSKLKKEGIPSSDDVPVSKSGIETPVNEKISLLRRQLEENKAKLAERGKSHKGIEEMVTQLKAQFDDSLQLINDTSSNFALFDTKIDYTKESSSEELYNILVNKEKRIADLNQKVHKLETTVLDLQENIKEKDCVIDARTKAITLMSESLSKKSKNTQDTLDETKEQMRIMQEDFVKLEDEMKARQKKLLDDLRLKNLEIAELQELNEELKKDRGTEISVDNVANKEEIHILRRENEDLLAKIRDLEIFNTDIKSKNEELLLVNREMKKEYETKIQELQVSLENSRMELGNTIKKMDGIKPSTEEKTAPSSREQSPKKTADDVDKLKRELSELNKNMIKVRAENKKKVKTLNIKIDSFKKMGDLNEQIVKLSDENDTLKEKIAELEEEKGSYQLKMIDSFSKDSHAADNSEEIKGKISELTLQLEEQMGKIKQLQSENDDLKDQINSSNEKLKKLSILQSEHVTSEMTFIELEELSEKLSKEKNQILLAKETLQNENTELLERIEISNREKQDLQSKLDQYIQENIELLDKLEKLSAEKVSSAESIEIVENLTQQEKLELEEYQKNLDPQSGKLKMSEEHLEGTPDLNDSVNQLTEETSELLQKIELFTVERREVMEKMESLTSENSQLNLELKQIENNRDLLTETYEQLQSEKEELDNKIHELESENSRLIKNVEALKQEGNVDRNQDLTKKLYELEEEYIKLGDENDNLRKELKFKAEILQEKHTLESELKKCKAEICELQQTLKENQEEVLGFQTIIEENKEEFIKSASNLYMLEESLRNKELEIKEYKAKIDTLNSTITDFNETVDNLEKENKNHIDDTKQIDILGKQVDELKETLNENLKQIGDYENELEENSRLVKELHLELKEMKNKNSELQNILQNGDEEHSKAIILLNKEIEHLKEEIMSKDEMFHKVSNEMREKVIAIQKKTESNTETLDDIREPLQNKIEELTNKNKALTDKMKKITANFKKKTQICQDLEQKLSSNQEKWESELSEKNLYIKEAEGVIEELRVQANASQAEIKQLQQILNDKKQEAPEPRSEISLQDELSGSFIEAETVCKSSDTTPSKIQELELIIETRDCEIANYKERIGHLEEMLAKIDERRESLEQKTTELGVKLLEKSQSFEEISKTEDILEEKVKNLSKYTEEVEKKLEEVTRDYDTVFKENHELKVLKKKLNQKLGNAQERVNDLLKTQQNEALFEQELEKSKIQISALEQEIKRLENEKLQLETSAQSDLEKLDNDWQLQLQIISKEKSDLAINCEKLNEKIAELTEYQNVLLGKIQDTEEKLEKSYELQKASDNELIIMGNEMEKLNFELQEKNKINEERSTEYLALKSSEQRLNQDIENLKNECENLKERLNVTFQELNSSKDQLQQVQNELEQVKISNEELKAQLQREMNAKKPVGVQEAINLFPSEIQEEDPFSFISQTPQTHSFEAQQIGTAEEPSDKIGELLQKIRTLEFMLKNVEIERDDVLNQCSHLSGELMRFVYEKEGHDNLQNEMTVSNLSHPEQRDKELVSLVESQILQEDYIKDTDETKFRLKQLEFTETKDLVDNNLEEPCQKKEAYLCHPDEKTALESQVYPAEFFQDTKETQLNLQAIEFEETKQYREHDFPVQGDLCHKKTAYLCHKDEVNPNTFGEDDDGWGWSPEEAKIEQQHIKDYESNPLRKKIVELEDKIKVLEMERENKNKEYQELQVKSGKLIKKLKELKVKNEALQSSKKQKGDDMFELENAIQEELNDQIKKLEKKISEVEIELCKEKTDRQNLQKNIEKLSSSNQKLSELKEKQDIEIIMWQRKSEELNSKLQQFDWDVSEDSPKKVQKTVEVVDAASTVELQRTISELNETIKDLTLDNEELQALLEEQRMLRLNAEKVKIADPLPVDIKNESEYVEILDRKEKLENELLNVDTERKKIQDELNKIIKENDSRMKDFELLHEDNIHLRKIIEEKDEMLKNVSTTLEQTLVEKGYLENMISEKSRDDVQIPDLLEKIRLLEEQQHEVVNQKTVNFQEKEALSQENYEMKAKLDVFSKEQESLLLNIQEKESEINNLQAVIEERTSSLKDNLDHQMGRIEQLIQENENLSRQKVELEEQMKNLLQQLESKDSEFEVHVQKLNQQWQELVDQRGSDVAESWKLHLETRESEFDQIETKLKKEIIDLEEKCNVLVNENNELRKNVDTEIRNEVDKLSALQQQINERQQYINELSQVISGKQVELDNYELQISQLKSNIDMLQASLEEKDLKISELLIVIETTQKQFDEKRAIVEELVKKLEERSSSPILFNLESIVEEFDRQMNSCNISHEQFSQLQKDISDKNSIITNLQNDISLKTEELNDHKKTIETNLVKINEMHQQIENTNTDEKLRELNEQLNIKEILLKASQNELNAKLEELQASQLRIEELESFSADHQQLAKGLSDRLVEMEDLVANLTKQLQESQESRVEEDEDYERLQYRLQKCEVHNEELRTSLNEKTSLLDALNEELEKQSLIHLEREAEVNNLKTFVEDLQKSHANERATLEENQNNIIETQSREIENLKLQLTQKQPEEEWMRQSIDYLNSQVNEQKTNIEQLVGQIESYRIENEELSRKLKEQSELQERYEGQSALLGEEEKQMAELKAIIEDQVLKIEELKKKLFEKSNDYDSLIAELDVRKDDLKGPEQASARPPMGQGQLIGPTCEDDLNEWVSRPELDIALYMLHQRDVRCEELTVELTQLLEERDTLQLRLSNALREKEEFRRIAVEGGEISNIPPHLRESSPSKGAIPKGRVSEIVLKSSGTELATEAQEGIVKQPENLLENKLSELKNIGYKRDKTLLDEQQHRRLQQLSIMQQHMDEASKLPSEAAARLVDANYTLSRDVQSPSKVLLNWLWGRSTPKVNEL